MKVIGIGPDGTPVQFEADAQTIESDVALVAHGASAALGASSGAITTLRIDSGGVSAKGATSSSGAATLNKASGVITSEALTTPVGSVFTLTIANSVAAASDIVMASLQNGSNSAGDPVIQSVTPGNKTLTIKVLNAAGAALNGTLKIAFVVFKV